MINSFKLEEERGHTVLFMIFILITETNYGLSDISSLEPKAQAIIIIK